MRRISWIGVGIMGKAMVRNLMKAGYKVHIYARHPEKVADVVSILPLKSAAPLLKGDQNGLLPHRQELDLPLLPQGFLFSWNR